MSLGKILFEKETLEYSYNGGFDERANLFQCIENGDINNINSVMGIYLFHLYSLVKEDYKFAYEIIYYVWAQLNFVVVRAGVSNHVVRIINEHYYQKLQDTIEIQDMIELTRLQVLEFTNYIASLKKEQQYSILIQKCCEFVRKNIYEKLTVSFIAENLHFSKSYVSHKFKEETGITLKQFIRSEKIEQAKRLIVQHKSLNDISGTLGFASQSHFTDAFKNEIGMTPKQYKKFNSI